MELSLDKRGICEIWFSFPLPLLSIELTRTHPTRANSWLNRYPLFTMGSTTLSGGYGSSLRIRENEISETSNPVVGPRISISPDYSPTSLFFHRLPFLVCVPSRNDFSASPIWRESLAFSKYYIAYFRELFRVKRKIEVNHAKSTENLDTQSRNHVRFLAKRT